MAWMSPKRRGRAQRRLSGKTQLVRGQLNFGLCPAPRRNCHRKNCCSGTPDHPRGQPDNFCGGAHHVGCVKGRRLRTTLGSLRRDSSPGKTRPSAHTDTLAFQKAKAYPPTSTYAPVEADCRSFLSVAGARPTSSGRSTPRWPFATRRATKKWCVAWCAAKASSRRRVEGSKASSPEASSANAARTRASRSTPSPSTTRACDEQHRRH